jgi:hypothetical protein
MTTVDQFSLTTTPIEQFFNETLLGTATGFVWSNSRKILSHHELAASRERWRLPVSRHPEVAGSGP